MTAVATEATLLDLVPWGRFVTGDWLATPGTLAASHLAIAR